MNNFNAANRWRKRGIATTVMEYRVDYYGAFPTYVAIYHSDGTVVVSHGGIECGQGMNTKVAQVVAFALGIPYENVSVKASNNVTGANATITGGSVASESVCFVSKNIDQFGRSSGVLTHRAVFCRQPRRHARSY